MNQKIILVFLILFFASFVNADTYPYNFSFEDYNFQTLEIEDGESDRGWDKSGYLFDANTNFATHGLVSGYIRASYTGGVTNYRLKPSPLNEGIWVLQPGESGVICLDVYGDFTVGGGASGVREFWVYVDRNEPGIFDSDNDSRKKFGNWVQNTIRPLQTNCFLLKNNESITEGIEFVEQSIDGSNGGAGNANLIHIDNLRKLSTPSINSFSFPETVSFENDVGFLISVKWDNNFSEAKDANVSINFTNAPLVPGSDEHYPATYVESSGFYEVTVPGSVQNQVGTFEFTLDMNYTVGGVVITDQETGSFDSVLNEAKHITFTPISNVLSFSYDSITVNPNNELSDLVFSLDNNAGVSVDANLVVNNSLDDGRQYFVYIANELQYGQGVWVFSDSLTYGTSSSYNDGVQKIFDPVSNKFKYQFIDTLLPLEKKYYRLTYRLPSRFYFSVNSDSFSNDYLPVTSVQKERDRDSWAVSSFSNMFTRVLDATAIVYDSTGTVEDYAFELQFNAWKLGTESVNLIVGKIDEFDLSQETIATIPLTQSEKRYSVPIKLNDENNTLVIKTQQTGNSETIFLSDYALNEKRFFRDRLSLLQQNGEPIKVWIDQNVESYKYVDEGEPFRFETTYYNREGDLTKQITEVYAYGIIDANRVSYQETSLASVLAEDINLLTGSVEGVYLINEGDVAGVATPMALKVTLCDANSCFAEQSTDFYLHNYPFFTTDFFLQTNEKARQLNKAPFGTLFVQSRIPETVERLKMRIYKGQYICPPGWLGVFLYPGEQCTASNTASDANVVHQRIFHEGIDFDCDSEDCSFNYDLENEFHYFQEGPHTTFTNLFFNTTDSNNFFSRALYEIGRQPLFISSELQGVSASQTTDINCSPSIFGTPLKGHATVEDMRTQLRNNEKLQPYLNFLPNYADNLFGLGVFFGFVEYTYFQSFTLDHFNHFISNPNNTEILPAYRNTPLGQLADTSGCIYKTNNKQAFKIVSKITTTDGTDLTPYLDGYFTLNHLNYPDNNNVKEYFNTRFYPIQKSFDLGTLQNILIWNTNLYTDDGFQLNDLNIYDVNIQITDESLQNQDGNDSIRFIIDNSVTYDVNGAFSVLPNVKFATYKDDVLVIEPSLLTYGEYLDEIEVTLYTDYSSFDPFASDYTNQIVTFSIGAEELLKLPNNVSYFATEDWNRFKSDHSGAVIGGLCYMNPEGLLTNQPLLENLQTLYGSTLVAVNENVLSQNLESGAGIVACGGLGGDVINAFVGPLYTSALTFELVTALRTFEGKKYIPLTMRFTDLKTNDYSTILQNNDLNEIDVNPEVLLNYVAENDLDFDQPTMKVELLGTTYNETLENNLVGVANINELIQNRKLKMRLVAKTDFFQKQAFTVIDLVDFERSTSKKGFLDVINDYALLAFNKYFFIIIAGAVLLAGAFLLKRTLERDR